MAKSKKKSKKKNKKLSITARILIVAALITSLVFLPTTFFMAIAMLPTFIAILCFGSTKALTIGAMNLAGCTPFLIEIWTSGHNFDMAIATIADPRTVIVVYCAAGIGYLIDWAVSGIVATLMVQRGNAKMKEIKKRQEELKRRWGPEVSGEIPLDEYGFPHESYSDISKGSAKKK